MFDVRARASFGVRLNSAWDSSEIELRLRVRSVANRLHIIFVQSVRFLVLPVL